MTLNDEVIAAIAQVCHEANRAWANAFQTKDAQPCWSDAAPEIRQSSIDGVKYVLQHPHVTAMDLHDQWMSYKQAQGWKSGPKDLKAKTHPCLVPYEQLTVKERLKDHVFLGIVKSFIKELGALNAS